MVHLDNAAAQPAPSTLHSDPVPHSVTAPDTDASPGVEAILGDPHGSSEADPGGSSTALVAIRHTLVQRFVCEILARDCGCTALIPHEGEMLADALERYRPDLLVVDTGDFPACCRDALRRFPRDRVVVVGPEPSSDYYRSAIDLGAGAWISRDSLADRLSTTIRALSQRAP